MKAKAYLSQLKGLQGRIDTIESIKEEMAAGVHPTVTHYSDMPASHDASSNSVDYRNAVYSDNVSSLTHEIKRLKEIQFEVRNTINCIKNNYLARILYLYYDKDLTWEKVAEEVGYSRQRIDQLHGQALQEVQSILDERDRNWRHMFTSLQVTELPKDDD